MQTKMLSWNSRKLQFVLREHVWGVGLGMAKRMDAEMMSLANEFRLAMVVR